MSRKKVVFELNEESSEQIIKLLESGNWNPNPTWHMNITLGSNLDRRQELWTGGFGKLKVVDAA